MKPKGSKLKAKTLEHTEKDNPLNSLHNIPPQHSIHTLQGILSRNTHSSDLHATPIDFTAYCTVLCTLTCAHTCVLPCTWTCKCNCIRSYTPYMSASVCMDVFIHTLTHTDWHKFVYLPANKHTHQSSNFAVAAWLITYAHIFMACFTLFWQLASTSLPWRHMARVRFACWEGVHPESDALVMSHFASLNGCETLWSLTE